MSHFTVLIVGDDIDGQLLPFTEDMSKLPDNLKTFTDITEESRKEYETETCQEFYCASSSSWRMVVSQSFFDQLENIAIGKTVDISFTKKDMDMMSYFKKDSKYSCGVSKDRKCPEKYIWVEVIKVLDTDHPDHDVCFEGTVKLRVINPPRELSLKEKYPTFEEFMDKYHGQEEVDEKTGKYGYWKNPNAKWDWYQIGGRWAGMFLLKPDVRTKNKPNFSYGWDESAKASRLDGRHVDSALKGEIDFDSPRKEMEAKAAAQYDFIYPLIKDIPANEPWGEKFWNTENGRDKYYDQPRCKHWKELETIYSKSHPQYFGFDSSVDEYLISREKFIENAGNDSCRTFAVLHNGKWYEKGEMGWFGVVHNETDKDTWCRFYWDLIKNLPEDTKLTVVDCHI